MAHDRAGRPAEAGDLIDVAHVVTAYYTTWPDVSEPGQRVSFGTSGHRGSSLDGSFTEAHIVATTQAICDYRGSQGIAGPLFLGRDTHALSEPATQTALEVFAANGVTVLIDSRGPGRSTRDERPYSYELLAAEDADDRLGNDRHGNRHKEQQRTDADARRRPLADAE